jgi:hypothetical protein
VKQLVIGSVVVIIAATGLLVWWSKSSPEPTASAEAPLASPPTPLAAPAPPPPPPVRAVVEVPAAPAPRPTEQPTAPSPAPREVMIATATKQANEKFEAVRPQLVQRCWVESHAAESGGQAGVDLEITFDASGKEIARGGAELKGSVPGVGSCVRDLEAGRLRIDPPGEPVTVLVKVALP